MSSVRERIDDVHARGRLREPIEPVLRKRAHDRGIHPPLQFRAMSSLTPGPDNTNAAGGSMTSPPNSRTAIVNVVRVRSDGFSRSRATCRPSSGRKSAPRRAVFLHLGRQIENGAEFFMSKVENRQKVLGTHRNVGGPPPKPGKRPCRAFFRAWGLMFGTPR